MTGQPDKLDVRIQLPAEQMAAMLADLEGFIERRATELARDQVMAADAVATEKIRVAQADAQRWQDLNAELRRQNAALEKSLAKETPDAR